MLKFARQYVHAIITYIINHTFTGSAHFKALKTHYIADGLVPFLHNYAEDHSILLPERIPGYKRDMQLLPSSTTKKASSLILCATSSTLL